MASKHRNSSGWRVVFYDANKKRQQIRLGQFNKKQVETICNRIEEIVSSQSSRTPLDTPVARWVRDLPEKLHSKLVNVGLVQPRESAALGPFLKGYVERRTDVKESTRLKWGSAKMHLIAFFGESKSLREITQGHADEFRVYLLKQKLAENSVRRYCGISKQFFGAALKKRLIEENPFSEVVAAVTGNSEKFYFLTREDSEKIYRACPDLQWRLIFALARFGGLRCPSEILLLRWSDIDWNAGRIRVRSPKTEHHQGKDIRMIPLFPELRPLLLEARADAGESEFVVTRYREATQNLRTTFQKIVKRAGLKAWPKLFQNLRSTRQTELCEEFPSHVVSAWIGNSEKVAKEHYLQVTDKHFERAAHVPDAKKVTTPVTTNPHEQSRTLPRLVTSKNENSRVIRGYSSSFILMPSGIMGAEGLEPPTPSV